jgi:hypothetical protein
VTIQGEIPRRYRDVSEMPDEALLCTIRGGHAWYVESDFDTEGWGTLPDNPLQSRAHVFIWRCSSCGRVKREVWDNYDGDLITKTYDGGHLLHSGRPYVADARREWISRLKQRGMSVLAAMRLLKVAE